MNDNAGSEITVGAEVVVAYPEGDADRGVVVSVDEVSSLVLVRVGETEYLTIPESVAVLGSDPEYSPDARLDRSSGREDEPRA